MTMQPHDDDDRGASETGEVEGMVEPPNESVEELAEELIEPVSAETVVNVERLSRYVSPDTVRASDDPPADTPDERMPAETVAVITRSGILHDQASFETVAVVEFRTEPGSSALAAAQPTQPVRVDDPPTRLRSRRGVLRGVFFAALFAGLVWGVVELRQLFSIQRQGPRLASSPVDGAPAETKGDPSQVADNAQDPDVDPEGRYPGLWASKFLRTHVKQVKLDGDSGEGSIIELGGGDAIASQAVTVVNLWATWCTPCRKEFAGFKSMFELNARDQQWGAETRFVPILVDDAENAGTAYAQYGTAMPAIHAPLVDLKLDQNGVRGALQAIKQLPPNADLPITLLFDCRRRIRWSKIGVLDQAAFNSLADEIDKLRGELRQEKCKLKRPSTQAGLQQTSAPGGPSTEELPADTPQPRAACNNDKKCDALEGEDCQRCPRDCPCPKDEKCKPRADGYALCKPSI